MIDVSPVSFRLVCDPDQPTRNSWGCTFARGLSAPPNGPTIIQLFLPLLVWPTSLPLPYPSRLFFTPYSKSSGATSRSPITVTFVWPIFTPFNSSAGCFDKVSTVETVPTNHLWMPAFVFVMQSASNCNFTMKVLHSRSSSHVLLIISISGYIHNHY